MSGGHLCKAEAPTEAAAETEGEKGFRYIRALLFLSFSRLSAPAPSSEGAYGCLKSKEVKKIATITNLIEIFKNK